MKIFKIIIAAFIVLTVTKVNLKAQTNKDSIQIYLLTASPGEETYAAFGHSALRVYIPSKNWDTVYNYGTFDFSTPNFYLKFTFGRLMYFLSKVEYERFVNAYQSWGQAIYEQRLLLSPSESDRLVQLLGENYLVENRFYRYGFFYDNCATRIRDIIAKAVNGKIVYDSTYIPKNETFRQLIEHYLGKTPWNFFSINILLGSGTDNVATINNYMFLPEHLKNILSQAQIQSGGSLRPLTGIPVELFPATIVFPKPNPYFSPVCILGILLIIIILLTWYEYKNNYKPIIWFDRILFIVTGLLGLLIAALWIESLHHELRSNFNIIWANPLNLFLGIMFFLKNRPNWVKYLVGIYTICLICFIPLSYFLTQSIPSAAYPIAGILIVRLWAIYTKQLPQHK